MDTLKDLIDALILVTQLGLTLRFILCCIKERDQEDQPQVYKKQKKTALIALILTVCVYDIPQVLMRYFKTGW
ncbi:MAG: hypothetical protein J6B50_10335 [Lachnospiraceae bacterium]|nr:hypothetical protein [Lachnospiraceae bacterium]MBP3505960.1 hypothetical protein [Lachnospiraceae bacterium]